MSNPAVEMQGPISARSTSTTLNNEPILTKKPSLHLRLAYFLALWGFKGVFRISLFTTRLFSRPRRDVLKPEIKTYPIRPDLRNRVFRPPNSEDEELPVYLDVHGGGWAVADPQTDDEFCSYLATNFHIMVIAIDYHKSPQYKYPHAIGDVLAITKEILKDESLNIDKSKIVLGGFSAGGNLAFAAAQDESLRGQLSGLVGLYPALDMTESLDEKLSYRPKHAPSDILASSANFLAWAYLPEGVDLRHPSLSPRCADLKHFPSNIYLVGAEFDMLCHEARQMAETLARFFAPDCERDMMGGSDQWRQGGVRWECARGRDHAFTHITKSGKKEKERVRFCKGMYNRIGSWLTEEVWSSNGGHETCWQV